MKWEDRGASDLLYGLSRDQASLLPAAQLQKRLAVLLLPHTDLKGGGGHTSGVTTAVWVTTRCLSISLTHSLSL